MILIDLVYINSNGGVVLAKELINYIIKSKSENKYLILCDNRNVGKFDFLEINFESIKKSEISRLLFYNKNYKRFNKILCFGNVPPPTKISQNVFIYFHNELILDNSNSNFNFFERLKFNIKRLYIKNLNKNYHWFVQSKHMKESLNKFLGVNNKNIIEAPIYNESLYSSESIKDDTCFIYPCNNQKHKNIERLLIALSRASEEINKRIKLIISINENDVKNIKYLKNNNLDIEFLGSLDYENLIDHYKKSNFLIFPSLKESFGLPLIEAVQMGCKVIAADLPYSKSVVNASIYFNPFSIDEIKNAIIKSINEKNLKNSEIKIKNSIEIIFNKYLD